MLKTIKILNVNATGEAPENALKKEVIINPEGILWVEPLPENMYGVSVVNLNDHETQVIPPSEIFRVKMMDGKMYQVHKNDLNLIK